MLRGYGCVQSNLATRYHPHLLAVSTCDSLSGNCLPWHCKSLLDCSLDIFIILTCLISSFLLAETVLRDPFHPQCFQSLTAIDCGLVSNFPRCQEDHRRVSLQGTLCCSWSLSQLRSRQPCVLRWCLYGERWQGRIDNQMHELQNTHDDQACYLACLDVDSEGCLR